jgi:hypothetical protein
MLLVTSKVRTTGSEFAHADDALASLIGRQVRVTERTYSVAYDFGVAPTMAALQSTHYLSRMTIEPGMHYIFHVYNANKVYGRVKLKLAWGMDEVGRRRKPKPGRSVLSPTGC